MRRMPIRARVTLAFTGAMAVLLAGLGLFVYLRLEAQLTETVDQGLETRVDELGARLGQSDGRSINLGFRPSRVSEGEESFSQIVTEEGRVLDGTARLGDTSALSVDQLRASLNGPTFVELEAVPGFEGPFRVLSVQSVYRDGVALRVVGASLEDREESLASLLAILLVGGSAALVLASLAGYAAIAAALRPVEEMREHAARISGSESADRLPVSPAADELSRLSETLNAMLERLETAIERERRFVDDASHELRTPLALHKTALEVALRYEADDPGLRAAVASAIEDVDRLIQLAEDLLVVARSEAGELAISRERVRARQLLESVGTRFESRAAEGGRRIEIDSPAELEILADPLRIEQALTNMVDNALRHGEGPVRLRAESTDGAVRLHVGDQGSGFGEEFLPAAFERFSRADTARTSGGSGLGLAIVETIARAHGGSAGATDTSSGPDVWIELPSGDALERRQRLVPEQDEADQLDPGRG